MEKKEKNLGKSFTYNFTFRPRVTVFFSLTMELKKQPKPCNEASVTAAEHLFQMSHRFISSQRFCGTEVSRKFEQILKDFPVPRRSRDKEHAANTCC